MAPRAGLAAIFPQDFLNAAFRIATQEARDPRAGARAGTLSSILNRYHHPGYGSNWRSWLLNPGQYAVLKKPSGETGAQARQFYNTPEGLGLLQRTASQLGGATDFRSTSYLKDQGLLYKYGDNLIPVNVGGQTQYLTPAQVRQRKLNPDFRENTFFSESGPAPRKWWQQLGPRSEGESQPVPIAVEPYTGGATPEVATTGAVPAVAGTNPSARSDQLMALGMFNPEQLLDFDPIQMLKRKETPTSSLANFMKVFGTAIG